MQTCNYMCYVPIWGSDAVAKAVRLESRGFEPHSGLQILKKQKFLPRSLVKIQYCGEAPWPRGSVLGLLPPGIKSCVWRTVCSHSSHHPREVLQVQFSLYVHTCSLEPCSFHLSQMVMVKTAYQSWPPIKTKKKLSKNWLVCKRLHRYWLHQPHWLQKLFFGHC